MTGLLMGAALIFVAYEGFELIPNAVREMKDPERDLPGAINISIVITTIIYITVALVAVGNLTPPEIAKYKEYALAVAAKPFLGHAGFLLIGLGALLSTASAINATMFGTARLAQVMAMDKELPQVFGHRERTKDIPWVSLLVITLLTLVFVNLGDLDIISSFSSATFLIIFASINLAALRLRRQISMSFVFPMAGLVLCMVSWGVLFAYLWEKKPHCLISIVVSYLVIASAEFLFSKRRIFFKGA
jgi:amino acid transporter